MGNWWIGGRRIDQICYDSLWDKFNY